MAKPASRIKNLALAKKTKSTKKPGLTRFSAVHNAAPRPPPQRAQVIEHARPLACTYHLVHLGHVKVRERTKQNIAESTQNKYVIKERRKLYKVLLRANAFASEIYLRSCASQVLA